MFENKDTIRSKMKEILGEDYKDITSWMAQAKKEVSFLRKEIKKASSDLKVTVGSHKHEMESESSKFKDLISDNKQVIDRDIKNLKHVATSDILEYMTEIVNCGSSGISKERLIRDNMRYSENYEQSYKLEYKREYENLLKKIKFKESVKDLFEKYMGEKVNKILLDKMETASHIFNQDYNEKMNIIKSEEFLDTIIKRIKDKQLSALIKDVSVEDVIDTVVKRLNDKWDEV